MKLPGSRLSIVIAVLVLLSACGSDTAITPTSVPPAATAARATAAPTAALVTAEPMIAKSSDTTGTAISSRADAPTATDADNGTATASSTITKTLDNELVLYQQPREGFAIALPAAWQQFDPTNKQFQVALQSVIAKNPSFSALLTSQAETMIAGNIKFMGVDLASDALTTGYLTNVNIIKQDLPIAATVEQVLDATVQQFDGMSTIVKPVTHQVVHLPAGEAGQLRYHLKLTTPKVAGMEAAVLQYLFIKDKTLYIVSMGTPAADEATYQPIFEQLAPTFQFLP